MSFRDRGERGHLSVLFLPVENTVFDFPHEIIDRKKKSISCLMFLGSALLFEYNTNALHVALISMCLVYVKAYVHTTK